MLKPSELNVPEHKFEAQFGQVRISVRVWAWGWARVRVWVRVGVSNTARGVPRDRIHL